MNPFLAFILFLLISFYLLDVVINILNVRHISLTVPQEFQNLYDTKKYARSQAYLKESTRFSLIQKTTLLPILIAFIVLGGFNWVDLWVRGFGYSEIVTGLLFIGVLSVLEKIVSLPFSIYQTFVIEQKFGFNQTTLKTFVSDQVKGLILAVLLGAPLLALVIWLFQTFGQEIWVVSWLVLMGFQFLILFIAPAFIMPLFNKFLPLGDNEEEIKLKAEVEKFAHKNDFKLSGIFKMDGSKRSTKANAFFTGFGKYKRIVLFDTLIKGHTVDELVAILAHEIGHYQKKHIIKQMILSALVMGLMLFLFSRMINHEGLMGAFSMQYTSVYASLMFIGFIFSPISRVFSLLTQHLSRQYEFEADEYAAKTFGKPLVLVDALKKLSVDHLSNLTPHPMKVLFEYSHPPVLERIKALKQFT